MIPEYSKVELPFCGSISCGFPSPADDFLQETLDINSLLIRHKESTFYARASGYSLFPLVIPGSILIVDRSVEWSDDLLAACYVDGEFTAKWIKKEKNKITLIPVNDEFPILEYKEGSEVIIWGIITAIVNNKVRMSKCLR